MNDLSTYWIDIIGLTNKVHDYGYSIEDKFFRNFEGNEISKGSLKCSIELIKNDNFINMKFDISGKVELMCDRSLDPFDYPLKIKKNILFKYGEEDREIDDEIEMISRNRQGINVGQYIYEFIVTEIPMKKLHPRFSGEESKEAADGLIYSSGTGKDEDDSEIEDPRWEALKKLRNNLN
ncbi:MAG: DUF177 domain-containing protein [Cyclobacteriaceae bacterium]|nr:DUF177 domain-containing protein [Cyclobacteriaceae bacterium]